MHTAPKLKRDVSEEERIVSLKIIEPGQKYDQEEQQLDLETEKIAVII